MLEEIMNMARQYGQATVVDNNEVPNEHNDAVIQEANNSITSGLQNLAQSGDTEALQGLLNGATNTPATQSIQNNFIDEITKKFGINAESAKGIAGSLIPSILGSLGSKLGKQGGSFNLESILTSIKGGGFNMNTASKLGAQFGLDKDGDGDVDFNDVKKMF